MNENIPKRFRVYGQWQGGKPCYHLVEYNPNTKSWDTIGEQKVNSTLKELKQLLIERYPDYRFYNFTHKETGFRDYFGFKPSGPEKLGWIN